MSISDTESAIRVVGEQKKLDKLQVIITRSATMTSKNKSRGASKSPSQGPTKADSKAPKVGGGGVKPPIDEKDPKGDTKTGNGASAKGNPGVTTNAPSWKGPQQDGSKTAENGSPFNGNSSQANLNAKLSGGALAFQPTTAKPSVSKTAPISFLNRDSTADDIDAPVIVSSDMLSTTKKDKGKGPAVQQPIGTRGVNFSPGRPIVVFTTDVGPNVVVPGGHYVKIVNAPREQITDTLKALYSAYDWQPKVRGTHCPVSETEAKFHNIFLTFNDIRDAKNAFEQIQTVNTNWNAIYVSQPEYADARRDSGPNPHSPPTSYYDGQVMFNAQFEGLTREFSHEHLFDAVQDLAKSLGDVLAFTDTDAEGGVWQFRAEYFNIEDAKHAVGIVSKDHPEQIGKWIVYAVELPDITAPKPSPEAVHYLANEHNGTVTPQKITGTPGVHYASPTGRTAWKVTEHGETVPTAGPTQLPRACMALVTTPSRHMSDPMPQTPVHYMDCGSQGARSGSWPGANYPQGRALQGYAPPTPASNGHNAMTPQNNRSPDGMYGTPTSVDIGSIMNGLDVRTTVMLRNLPNFIGFRELKAMLDEVCHGEYDFSYLRIDYKNNLNVGYGFVNFTDPMHIVAFIERYVGRPWPVDMQHRRRRARIADVSYATVQGYDCLVEKFRNSSVMDEFPDFRPKLWWTTDSAPRPDLIGKEKVFPHVNNESKHQRSRDNVTAVGLYSNGSGSRRGHNRHHQSQYDRGTPAQVREDQYNQMYNTMSPYLNGNYYGGPQMMGHPSMSMVPPPQPQFPTMPQFNMNGYNNAFTNGAFGGFNYPGAVTFNDPFVSNGGYHGGFPGQGRTHTNGRFHARPHNGTTNGGYHNRGYHSGVDPNQIPEAIPEHGGFVYEEDNMPADPNVNGGRAPNGHSRYPANGDGGHRYPPY